MDASRPEDLTDSLARAGAGDEEAARRLTPAVYERLRRLAASYLSAERANHTLQPTALVHEAFLNLVDQRRADLRGRSHFLAVAAVSMRRILVDHARRKGAARRRGGERVTLSGVPGDAATEADLLDLEHALARLAERSERQARIVEMRFFAGSTIEEIAAVLELSARTVTDDWRVAKAWLKRELARGGEPR